MIIENHIDLKETKTSLGYQENIPGKVLLDHELTHNIERIFLGLNLRKKNSPIFGSYYPPSRSDEYFFHLVKKGLNI